tara:strand:- start:2778 stop:3926 length:1149 start_codon:yes stop_codon:yes gene_type:complete
MSTHPTTYNPNTYPEVTHTSEKPKTIWVQETYEINDIRSPGDFKGYSFSEYKKTDVKKQLIDALKNNKLEASCYWSAELLCAGHFVEIWEIILFFTSKHIHLGNPKLGMYLEMRYNTFRNIMNKGTFLTELDARNDEECRKLFAEIMITLCLSKRKLSFEEIKLKQEEFELTTMKERLKASSMDYAKAFFRQKDPKEVFIAINEFAYNISPECKSVSNACYWYEWIIEFDASCKKKNLQCVCEYRDIPVENKFRGDVIWLIWDAIFHYTEEKNDVFISKIMNSLLHLFCIRYTNACGKRRKFLLYYAISLITEQVNKKSELITNKDILKTGLSKLNMIYKQIKKNEHSPQTDYLFKNVEQQKALERSIMQMEIINNMSFTDS